MPTVHLKEITRDNWRQAIRIEVAPEQKRFVASNLYSIAASKFNRTYVPLAIYDEADTMVGFLMYGMHNGAPWIMELMVAQQYQGRGYGRAAMEAVIRRIKVELDCREIFVSYVPYNEVAARLYRSLGFEDTGLVEDGEIVVRLACS